MTSTLTSGERNDPNFDTLRSNDAYALYFNQLSVVFRRLIACYQAVAARSHEMAVVRGNLERLLFDVELLRMKHAGDPDRRPLRIDVTDSGFPNHIEIAGLAADLQIALEKLRDIPSPNLLKRMLIDHLLKTGQDEPTILAQLAQSHYWTKLSADRVFLPYTPGEIVAVEGATPRTPAYAYSWGSYDFTTNRPYAQIMTFEHDTPNFISDHQARRAFMAALASDGSRAPDLGIMAMTIDEALEEVHPKIIKRLCVGPLYSRVVMENRTSDVLSPLDQLLLTLLQRHAPQLDDFILFFSDEMIISKRQEVTRTMLSPRSRLREIFHIPETDPESYRRRATVVHNTVLLPHALAQHLTPDLIQAFPQLGGRLLTYDKTGGIHGI